MDYGRGCQENRPGIRARVEKDITREKVDPEAGEASQEEKATQTAQEAEEGEEVG